MDITPSITLSNGHRFSWMTASGALGFDGRGWPWEQPLVASGLINTKLFTIVLKTLTEEPRVGNLKLTSPWKCIQPIDGGWVNKVGLTNGGVEWCVRHVAPHIKWGNLSLVASIQGDNVAEAAYLAKRLCVYPFKGMEVNLSCPNTGHANADAVAAIDIVDAASDEASKGRIPVGVKLGVGQQYLAIARELARRNLGEYISINTVPWELYSQGDSPLKPLQDRLRTKASPNGGGGGGVSGRAAQASNWLAMKAIIDDEVTRKIPVVGPSIWCYDDIERVFKMGAKAASFGSIHIARPLAPTNYVRRWGGRNHRWQPMPVERHQQELMTA